MHKRVERSHSCQNRVVPRETNLSIDVEAVEFLSQIVGGLGPTLGDRRRSERRPFPSTQNVAPVDRDGLPPTFAFTPVLCYDLSRTGISFFWPTEPTFKSVVLALSNGERTMHLMAGVRHFREGYWNRQRQFMVGCEFQCRVRYARLNQPDVGANSVETVGATA
jgi:hypothetical protein